MEAVPARVRRATLSGRIATSAQDAVAFYGHHSETLLWAVSRTLTPTGCDTFPFLEASSPSQPRGP